MANFGGGKAFHGTMEAGVTLGAMVLHSAIQDGIAAGRGAQHDARIHASVMRLGSAFQAERRKTARLEENLKRERGARKMAEIALWRQTTGR